MSAWEHLSEQSYEQLAMFVPAGELKKLQPNPYDYEVTDFRVTNKNPHADPTPKLWARKLATSIGRTPKGNKASEKFPSLYSHIKEEGVQQPVHLYHGEITGGSESYYGHYAGTIIANGMHRVAAAADINPDQLVPVQHYGSDEKPGTAFKAAVFEGMSR